MFQKYLKKNIHRVYLIVPDYCLLIIMFIILSYLLHLIRFIMLAAVCSACIAVMSGKEGKLQRSMLNNRVSRTSNRPFVKVI